MMRKYLWVLFVLLMAACEKDSPRFQKGLAEQTAVAFFKDLSAGRYEKAAEMYSGDYEGLASLNDEIPPDDHAALWKNGCEINGLQCLPIYRIINTEKFSLNEFRITVEFRDASGGVFVLGPCCGATAEEMPPVSQFDVYVIERDGSYFVTSLPVFQP